jgi:hypothetical protein
MLIYRFNFSGWFRLFNYSDKYEIFRSIGVIAMRIGHGAPRDIKNSPFYFSTSYQFAARKPIRISDPA